MRKLTAVVLTGILSVSEVAADGLSPGDLTLLITRAVGSHRLPSASLVTSMEQMVESGVAGVFMSDSQDNNYLVALAPSTLCQFSSQTLQEERFDADRVAEIGSMILSLENSGICKGIIHIADDSSTHIFIATETTLKGREGAWLSARGTVPIKDISGKHPNKNVAEAIVAQSALPEAIITIGDERFAITSEPETTAIIAVSNSGVSTIPLMLCSPKENHPLYSLYAGEDISEIAYRAVHGPYRYDPLAYFICP